MSGPENLKGFDYQITYSLLKTLEILSVDPKDIIIKFESLDEGEEDFNVVGDGWQEYYQLKKRNEGDHWTPADFKSIFEKFLSKDSGLTRFYFVTDGTANPEVKKLKKLIGTEEAINDDLLLNFLPKGIPINTLKTVLKRTFILTRHFSSDDDENPAKNLKRKVIEVLSRNSFQLNNTINASYSELWKLVYDYAREAREISIGDIKSDFEKVGIYITQKPWLDIPEVTQFQGRKEELDTILSGVNQVKKAIVYGINGIGKTWITSKFICDTAYDSTCWININRWTSTQQFLFLITTFLFSKGHNDEANKLQKSEVAEQIPAIVRILETIDITIVVDSVNSANNEFFDFIEGILKFSLDKKIKGKIIVSSTKRIHCYTDIDLKQGKIFEYNLLGFSLQDTRILLSTIIKNESDQDIEFFHNALGGHPMAITFLKELVNNDLVTKDELIAIKSKSMEVARDWVIEKSILQLSDQCIGYLHKLSMLDGEVDEDEINCLLDSSMKPKYLLRELYTNNLISFHENKILIHDSIKEVAQNMLTNDYKISLHKKLVDYYFSNMVKEKESGDGILWETIFKWGYHLEKLANSNAIEDKYKIIINLPNEEIDALWAIERFGYPFDFKTDDLSSSVEIVSSLIDKDLVAENTNNGKTYMHEPFEFTLTNVDVWQQCFVSYLCQSRNLSGHLGYVSIIKPNFSWHIQHINCLWEHCIEFMPLPPIPRSEQIEHREFIKEQFRIGAYNDKTPEQKEILQRMVNEEIPGDVPEERDLEMEARSCPIFGHCCPGGSKQADECRKELSEDYEEDAFDPTNQDTDSLHQEKRNVRILNIKMILVIIAIIASLTFTYIFAIKK